MNAAVSADEKRAVLAAFTAAYPFRADTASRAVFPAGIAAEPDFGPYNGHALDPRTPEPSTLEDKLEAVRNALIELKAAELFYSRAVCADSLDDPERDERKGDADVADAIAHLAERFDMGPALATGAAQ